MGNELLRAELSNLERKIKLLLSDHSQFKKEITQLRNENANLKAQMEAHNEQLVNFQNQGKISKIVDSMLVDGRGATELKEEIANYIKEIDKCIAHLGEVYT